MKPKKTESILLGALVSVVLGAVLNYIAFNGGLIAMSLGSCVACLTAFVGPALAVWHYTSTNELTLQAGQGAGLGALTGVAAAVSSFPLVYVLRAVDVLPTQGEVQERIRRIYVDRGLDPAALDQSNSSMDWLSTPVAELAIGLVVGAIIGAIAGAIAASVFKKGPEEEYDV